MARFLKYAGIVLAILAGLLILSVVVVNIIPSEKYKSLISSGVKSATGRELTIEGYFDIKLLSTLAFKASGVKFANAEWGSRPDMMSVDNIEGEVALFPLLKGILDATLVVDNPDLLLETDTSGQGNWQFGELDEETAKAAEKKTEAKKEIESGGGLPLRPLIRKLHLNGTRITFLDGKSGDQINFHSEKLHIGSPEDVLAIDLKGRFNDIPLALSGGLDNAEFFVDNQPANVKLDGHFGDAKLAVTGTAGPLNPTFDVDIIVNLDTDSVAAFSPLAGRELPDIGPLSASAKLTGKDGKYAVNDLLTTLDDKTLTVEAKGSITDLPAFSGLKLDAKVNTGHLTEILTGIGLQTEYKLPDSLNAEVVAEGNLDNLAIKNCQVKIHDRGLNAIGNAEVKNIISLEGVKADLVLDTESLDLISEIVKTELPPFGPLKATATIVSKGENLGLMEIKVDINGKIIHADVAGSIGDPLKLKDVNADINIGVDSLAWLADYIKTKLPPLGSLKASATIASKGETFKINNIKADLKGDKIQAKVAGSVEDVLKLTGINADINFAVDSLVSLDPIVKKELPDSEPITLEAKISSKDGLKAPLHIDTEVKSDGVLVNFKGSIAEPLAIKGIDLGLTVEADSLEKVGKLTGVQLQGQKPVKLEGKFTADEKTYELAGLHLKAGEVDVKGNVAFQQPSEPGDRPRVSAKLHVGKLDRSKRQVTADTPAETENSSQNKEEEVGKEDNTKKDKIFPSEPLPFGPLRSVDADIELTVENLMTPRLQLDNIAVRATLENGRLNVKPLQANVGQGAIEGMVVLDARNKPASLSADIEMTDATFHNFGGKFNFIMDLEGKGDSIATIMAGLNGQFAFHVRDAILKRSSMTNFGAGLLDSLNPFAKSKESTELNCAILRFDIKDGIADANRKIAAQMTDVTWFGSGEIDLKTEAIDFGVHSKARKFLAVGVGNLAKLVHVGGTLAEPKIALDPKDLAVKYGKYTAAMATGGLTLAVDHLWGKIKANTDVCAKILEDLEADE